MADTERKLKELQKRVKKSENGLNINCKKPEYMVVSKRNTPIWKLQIGDIKIKQVQSFKYLAMRSLSLEEVKAAEINRRMFSQFGKCNIDQQKMYEWVERFKAGSTCVVDKS